MSIKILFISTFALLSFLVCVFIFTKIWNGKKSVRNLELKTANGTSKLQSVQRVSLVFSTAHLVVIKTAVGVALGLLIISLIYWLVEKIDLVKNNDSLFNQIESNNDPHYIGYILASIASVVAILLIVCKLCTVYIPMKASEQDSSSKSIPSADPGSISPINLVVLASALDDPESALSLDPTLDSAEYADYFSPYANIPDDPGYLSVKASLKGAPDVLPDGRTVRQYLEQKTSEFLGDTGATARGDGVYERIFFVRGGMTGVAVDAICNAANESGLDGGGINGAIHKAVGVKVLEAHVKRTLAPLARNGQRCPPTSARIVCVPADSAARINRQIKFIVYATGPRGEDATRLRQTYWAALTKAHRAGARHFALTCISTSLFGYPPEKAATVAIATVRLWLRVHSHDSSMLVVFNMYDPKSIAAYKKEFGCK